MGGATGEKKIGRAAGNPIIEKSVEKKIGRGNPVIKKNVGRATGNPTMFTGGASSSRSAPCS